MNAARLQKLVDLMEKFGLTAVALNPGPSLVYLTGFNFHLMERPTVLLVTRTGSMALVLPALERGKVPDESPVFKVHTYDDDPAAWQLSFTQAVDGLNLHQGQIGVEPSRLRFLELSFLKKALPEVEFVDGQQVLGNLRILKDSEEIDKMRKAVQIAQNALIETLKHVREGMTEKAIANKLIIQLLKAGSQPDLPFSPIVAIGENSANPHAQPSDRALAPGDLVLIDWGAGFDGYYSDITRTFTYGGVDPKLTRIAEIVLAANQAGREAGKAGVQAGAVDRAARSVIVDAGYGAAFIHRTGHGLGMEAHEEPYIYEENTQILATGMAFTIEPGIYLAGKGGVRIEDDVIVTEEGLDSLTDLPREVQPLESFMV